MSSIINPGGGGGGGGLTQTFRGLSLRTHPDADKALAQVLLVHADEIVFHDGTRVASGLDRLVADLSVSGAGGLDTGSEAASTWYEAHAIRKSSDGTLALLLHRAKDYFLDEQQTTSDAGTDGLRASSISQRQAQTGDTDETGPCPFVDFKINRIGTLTGNVWAAIYATASGVPTGAALATSDKLSAANVSTTAQWLRFPFRQPTTLAAGVTYAFVLDGDFAINASNYIELPRSTDLYAAGSQYSYNGSVWSASSARDLLFKIYVTRNDAALTLPSGYDQRCLVGHAYNNTSANLAGFVALDRDVKYMAAATVVSGGTAALPALTDIGVAVPPVPVSATHWRIGAVSGSGTLYVSGELGPSWEEIGLLQTLAAGQSMAVGVGVHVVQQSFYYAVTAPLVVGIGIGGYRW